MVEGLMAVRRMRQLGELEAERLMQELGVEKRTPWFAAVQNVLAGLEQAAVQELRGPLSTEEAHYRRGRLDMAAEAQEVLEEVRAKGAEKRK